MCDSPASYYCNAINIRMSAFDILLDGGKNLVIDPEADPGPVKFQKEFSIYLSPQHFKVLTLLFADNLKKYEEMFGVINLPQLEQQKAD